MLKGRSWLLSVPLDPTAAMHRFGRGTGVATALAKEPAMNDPTSIPPANGSTSTELPHPEMASDNGPALAPSPDGGDGAAPDGPADQSLHSESKAERLPAQTANLLRMGALHGFHSPAAPVAMPAPPASLSPLEERLRRLEDALAQVADPKQIENRIADRVAERLTTVRPIPVAQIVTAPAPQGAGPNAGGMILDLGKRFMTASGRAPEHHESGAPAGVRRTFQVFDLLTEARAIWCMFTDPRYKMSWAGRLVPLALGLFLLTSSFLVPGAQLPVVGTLIDKLADLIPAFLFFKLLTYEARRYRETAPDLPADLRL
jgi:hypothetical protein